jgi:hypothetical protein
MEKLLVSLGFSGMEYDSLVISTFCFGILAFIAAIFLYTLWELCIKKRAFVKMPTWVLVLGMVVSVIPSFTIFYFDRPPNHNICVPTVINWSTIIDGKIINGTYAGSRRCRHRNIGEAKWSDWEILLGR